MSRRKSRPREFAVCIACRRATFDPFDRDVSDWPLIEDHNASEHCHRCWMERARTQGRPLGKPEYRR